MKDISFFFIQNIPKFVSCILNYDVFRLCVSECFLSLKHYNEHVS